MAKNAQNGTSDAQSSSVISNEAIKTVSKEDQQSFKDSATNGDDQNDELRKSLGDSASQDDSTAESEGPQIGTSCTVMKLWEGRTSTDQHMWLTEPPEIEPEDQSVSESPQYAITLLHRIVKEKSKQKLETIIVRSPELRQFLEDTIPNIASLYNESEHGLAISSPFRLLFWHLDQINAAAKGGDQELSKTATLLQGALRDEFREILVKRKELVAAKEMNFNTAWTLFKPGITCVTGYADDIVAVKVSSIDYSRDPMGNMYYRIKFNTLAWDGEYFGWQDAYTDIMEFAGRQKIKNLDIFPIEFHEDANLVDKLAARGRKFVGLAIKEPYMMSFNGEALDRETSPLWWQGEQKKKISERVELDARAYNHYYRRISVTKWMKRDAMNDALQTAEADRTIFVFCCPEFHCFALQRKKWARLWIDHLDEVVFNEMAYPSLVLPNDYKELLLAFAEAQIDGYGFDDVIAGKGQGILMLLAGSPGTGKTLTAEAMAEHMKRPLYSVSAGELGSSAGGMENELDRVLELTTRWNAVLLLDEADVFLEKRTDNDLQRNTIVSVFLRKLEYYRGIMFLTTNRASSFDEAFKSRIHIAIQYPDLDVSARRLVWSNFLKSAQETYQHGVDISADEIDQLSQKLLNGREIRNIVKSAQLLASRSRRPLQISHLNTVWKVEHEDSVWRVFDG